MKTYLILMILLLFTRVCYCQVDPNDIDWSWDTLMDIYNAGGYGSYVTGQQRSKERYLPIELCVEEDTICFDVEVPNYWAYDGCEFKLNESYPEDLLEKDYPDNATIYSLTCRDDSRNFYGGFSVVRDSKNSVQEERNYYPTMFSQFLQEYRGIIPSGQGYYVKYSLSNAEPNNKSIEEDINHMLSTMQWVNY
jgi:hypothetical protein